jgi:RHS repeat-associated protein
MVTNHAGGETEDILFYPWGQNSWQLSGTGGYIYAGMPQYDPNVEVSYAKYRFYSPNLGRWHSPDPLGGDITNPQSLNRYAYVMNNHTTLTDPLGLGQCPPGTAGQGCNPEQASQSNLFPFMGSFLTCNVDGVDMPCGFAFDLYGEGAACIGNCSTPVVLGNTTYNIVQTAGPTVVIGPNGEEVSDESLVGDYGVSLLEGVNDAGATVPSPGLGTGGAAGCPQKILASFNAQFGTNRSMADVRNLGQMGGTVNINVFFPLGTVSPGQVVPGRFGGGPEGTGSSLHVANWSVGPRPGLEYAGQLFDIARAHLDQGNAYIFPSGTWAHLVYVLTHSAGPCP